MKDHTRNHIKKWSKKYKKIRRICQLLIILINVMNKDLSSGWNQPGEQENSWHEGKKKDEKA